MWARQAGPVASTLVVVQPVMAEIIGPDLLIILVIVAVLFGGSQLPKLARGLGSASHEFRKGLEEGVDGGKDGKDKGKTDGKADEEKPSQSS